MKTTILIRMLITPVLVVMTLLLMMAKSVSAETYDLVILDGLVMDPKLSSTPCAMSW